MPDRDGCVISSFGIPKKSVGRRLAGRGHFSHARGEGFRFVGEVCWPLADGDCDGGADGRPWLMLFVVRRSLFDGRVTSCLLLDCLKRRLRGHVAWSLSQCR
jgi:hypothetical protein